jgi:hypothetical protein
VNKIQPKIEEFLSHLPNDFITNIYLQQSNVFHCYVSPSGEYTFFGPANPPTDPNCIVFTQDLLYDTPYNTGFLGGILHKWTYNCVQPTVRLSNDVGLPTIGYARRS